jgi:hypothetical protein
MKLLIIQFALFSFTVSNSMQYSYKIPDKIIVSCVSVYRFSETRREDKGF